MNTLTNKANPVDVSHRETRPVPPHSNTGGKFTGTANESELQIDWLRMSGPRANLRAALHQLNGFLGQPTYGKGRYFLSNGYHYGSAALYYDDDPESPREHIVVDLPSTALAEFAVHDLMQLADVLLRLGFRATRLDIASDFVARPDLIERVKESCLNGELCHSKTFAPKEEYNSRGYTAYGCNVGKRGKLGSGRYLRVYDKGLETKTKPRGEWVRWEAELTQEPANEALISIVQSDNIKAVALSHCFGVCDFREYTGDPNISRRPRCKWFADLLEHVKPERVTVKRPETTMQTFKNWMETAVLPKMQTLSAATDTRMDVVLSALFDIPAPDPEHLEDPKIRTLCIELDTDPSYALHKLNSNRMPYLNFDEEAKRGIRYG